MGGSARPFPDRRGVHKATGGPAALEGAFARRAITERAKGILRERHSIDEQLAFEMLRDESHRSNHKLIEIAEAVTASVNPASQVVC